MTSTRGQPEAGRYHIVLFDLGGVVCQFSHQRRLAALASASGLSVAEVHQRLFASGFDLECDRGRYTLEQQCAEICARLGVQRRPQDLAELWAQAFVPNAAVLELVQRVRSRATTATLTNNGPLVDLMLRKWFPDVVAVFDYLCFSHQVISVKPEPDAYLGTLKRLIGTPGRSILIDDTEQNVNGARAVGIDAVRFVSADRLREDLQARELI